LVEDSLNKAQRLQHPFNGPLSGTAQLRQYQKGKTNLHLLEQETVSGSDISFPRQISMPAPHHSVFTDRMPFPPSNHQHQSMKSLQLIN